MNFNNNKSSNNEKSIKCSFCHNNLHENVKKFTYIATLLPLNETFSFENYQLSGRITSFQKEISNANCKDLLNYTTW